MSKFSRRKVLTGAALAAGSVVAGLPASAEQSTGSDAASKKLKVVVAGGHPDDPESGCGGTIARLTDLGHEVVILYLTRGEAGIHGKSHDEAAAIRTAEVHKACEILKARPVFAGQIDGSTEVNPAQYEHVAKLLEAEKPDVLFTHWPVDSNRDHRACSLLAYDYWKNAEKKPDLYYFEVESGRQTQCFPATDYVDITTTEARKRAACYAHASQHPEDFYGQLHDQMNRFRGMENQCQFAEAFVRHNQNTEPLLWRIAR